VTQRGSLDVIEEYVRREFDAEERRADAVEGKAGLVLGFSGVLVSLGTGYVWAPLALAARVVAGLAGLVAVLAFAPGAFPTLDVAALHEHYLAAEPDVTRGRVVGALIDAHGRVRATFRGKLARLRLAVRFLGLAVALMVTGSIVEALRQLTR
jgi:hypothetical protein